MSWFSQCGGHRALIEIGDPSNAAEDIGKLEYAAWPTWEQLSGGTRLLADGAANLDTIEIDDVNAHVRAIIEEIDTGSKKVADYEPVIIVATEGKRSTSWSRATAD